jgi:ankyrin repeat protein
VSIKSYNDSLLPFCSVSSQLQVKPSVGFSGGETAFLAVASGWSSNADPTEKESLRVRYGICKAFDCEGDGVVWSSDLLEPSAAFEFNFLPAGDTANGNLTTVRMCAVKLLGGEVVMSQTCTKLHVEVTRPERYERFTGTVLTNALQNPALRLQAASIAVEQIVAAGPNSVSQDAVTGSVLDMMSADVVTEATLSSCLSIIQQLSALPPSNESSASPALGGAMIAALASGAARLLDVSAGDFGATVELANGVLGTLAQVLTLDNLDGLGDSTPAQSVGLLNDALAFTATALLEGMVASDDVQRHGTDELSVNLFKGDTEKLVLRKLELGQNSAPPTDNTGSEINLSGVAGGRRHRRLQQSDLSGPRFGSVATRRGSSEVTLQGFVGPGCDNATFTGNCAPRDASVTLVYVADSSYLLTALGREAFRRALAVSNETPLTDTDTVHTASGVLSVTGSTGALVPMLAVQLPLDLQTGMSDLREDNKICARMDYDRMEVVTVGLARIVTTVKEFPAGYSINSHTAVCWADMYADYVIVQISHTSTAQKREMYVGPRDDELVTPKLVDPGPLDDGTAIDTGYLAGMCAGFLLLMGIVCAGGICDCCGWRPIRRLRHFASYARGGKADSNGHRWATGTKLALMHRRSTRSASPSIATFPRRLVLSPSTKLDHMYSHARAQSALSVSPRAVCNSRAWKGLATTSSKVGGYQCMALPLDSASGGHYSSWGSMGTPESAPSSPEDADTAYANLERWQTAPTGALSSDTLRAAVESNDAQTIADVLSQCADPNLPDSNKRTALHLAARAGRAQAVKALVGRSGSNPGDVALNLADIRGQTPLHLAVAYGHLAVVRVLLSRTYSGEVVVMDMDDSAEKASESDLGSSIMRVESLRSEGGNRNAAHVIVNKTDNNGCTALHVAAHFGHDEVAGELLNAGGHSGILMEDHFGNTPLHHAAMQGRTDTVLLLLRHSLIHDDAQDCVLTKNSRDQVRLGDCTLHVSRGLFDISVTVSSEQLRSCIRN